MQLSVQRDAALAWLGVYFAERRIARLSELERENRVLHRDARRTHRLRPVDAGRTHAWRGRRRWRWPTGATTRKRDIAKARAALRRWVGERADEALAGEPPALLVRPEQLRDDMHRHAEIAPYQAMQAAAQAEVGEADAEQQRRLGAGSWCTAVDRSTAT